MIDPELSGLVPAVHAAADHAARHAGEGVKNDELAMLMRDSYQSAKANHQ